MQGRFSTPLHFAAGYNRVEVVEYLLQHRADVTAKDKGWVVAAANVYLAYSAVITRGEVYLCAMCVHFLCQSVPSTTFFQPYNRICPDGATCFMLLPFVTFLPTHTHAHAHAHTPTHAHTHTHHTHTRGLVPLHNACSYGHYEVAEQMVQHMANVNVVDLWKFTPLHEAAAKGKYEICRLLLKVNT